MRYVSKYSDNRINPWSAESLKYWYFLREIFLKRIIHFPALVHRVYWRVFNLFLMSHGHHYKHEPRLYLSVVRWCHRKLSKCAGLGFAFQTIVLFSLTAFTVVCSASEAIWGNCSVWDLLLPCPPCYMTPGCTFKTTLAVLYLVHMMQKCVPVQYRGGDTCVWACQFLPIQHPPPFLTCFLIPQLFTSCLLMDASKAKQKFSCRSQEPQCCLSVLLALFLRRDAWAFSATVSRRLWASGFFPPCPPWVHRCFRRLMSLKVWSQTTWLILYMKTQYLWQLNSNQ